MAKLFKMADLLPEIGSPAANKLRAAALKTKNAKQGVYASTAQPAPVKPAAVQPTAAQMNGGLGYRPNAIDIPIKQRMEQRASGFDPGKADLNKYEQIIAGGLDPTAAYRIGAQLQTIANRAPDSATAQRAINLAQKATAQTKSGAALEHFLRGFVPGATQRQEFWGGETPQEIAKRTQPKASTLGGVAGSLAQSALMYGSVGKAAEAAVTGVPKLAQAINAAKYPGAAKFAVNMLANQAADTVIQTPQVIMQSIADNKNLSETAKEVLKQQATDLLFNVVSGGAVEGATRLFKAAQAKKAGQAAQSVVEQPDNVALDIAKSSEVEPPPIKPNQIDPADATKSGPSGRFGQNTVGAAQAVPDMTHEEAVKQFGAFEPGEMPFRDVQIAKETPYGKTQRFSRTVAESRTASEELVRDIKSAVADGTFSYTPISDKAAIQSSLERIQKSGYEDAMKDWEALIRTNSRMGKHEVALGEQLLRMAAQNKDNQTAVTLAADLAMVLQDAGQTVQAAKLLKRMTPEGALVYMTRTIGRINDRFGTEIKPSKELIEKLFEQVTPEGIEGVVKEVADEVAEQVPRTFLDQLDSWRYLAMLGNPRTHIRNMAGNLAMVPMRKAKNAVAAGVESLADRVSKAAGKGGIERTRMMLTSADQNLIDYAKKDAELVKDILTSGNKYTMQDSIMMNRKAFSDKNWFSRTLNKIEDFNSNWLEKEDWWFLRSAYIDEMSSYMKAKGITPEFLNKGGVEATRALEAARDFAMLEAQKATFRDANALSTFLNNIGRGNKPSSRVARSVVGAVVPFKKTPVNIVRRGVEYSPIGLVKSLTYDMAMLKKPLEQGGKTAAEVINNFSAGLVGTGAVGAGMWLARNGIVTGANADWNRQTRYENMQGAQEYAIQLPDGSSYTIDWMSPAIIPVMIGVELYNGVAKKGDVTPGQFSAMLNALAGVGDPVFNLTMMQGVTQPLQSYSSGSQKVSDIGMNVATNFAGQFVPTLWGQAARTIDPTRRSTYVSADDIRLKPAKKFVQKMQNKIPFASKTNEPHIDLWGREQEPKSLGLRALKTSCHRVT